MPEAGVIAALRGVTKRYGGVAAVNDLSLEIAEAEFFSILGPSGCGKTTTLRLLGGFVVADEGEIFLEGRDVTAVPPYSRNVNTVFQSYALFDHLNVAENVAFGLRRRRVPKAQITERVGRMLELVRLGHRARAMPRELSGGQQQRVALARALVNMPALLLLDEPLGALDLKLRREMQVELKAIQREVGITFVFVTHDQEEALTMSDRMAVMNDGRIEQMGQPHELYEQPANAFVAGFIGTSNLLAAQATADGIVAGTHVVVPAGRRDDTAAPGAGVMVSIRPEKVLVGRALGDGCVRLRGTVSDVVYLGASTQVYVQLDGCPRIQAVSFHAGGAHDEVPAPGDEVTVGWHPEDVRVVPSDRTAGR
jgi:spermidine/putrescine transport system ATP-binding protein